MDAPFSNVAATINEVNDVVFEVLMRVDPCDMFRCILVSKEWLCMITSPRFRTNYLKVWKYSESKLVGLLRSDKINKVAAGGVELLATSEIGRSINARYLLPPDEFGFLISKSPEPYSRRLLLGGIHPERFYVHKAFSDSSPVQLPPPPACYQKCMANIISPDDATDFKVVLARASRDYDDTLSVQTYCSRAGKWDQSMLRCAIPVRLGLFRHRIAEGGVVTNGGGVVYWKAFKDDDPGRLLVAWDINKCSISLVPEPPFAYRRKHGFNNPYYGVSPQGSLLAATFSYENKHDVWGSEGFIINIWALDDPTKDWYSLYNVKQGSILMGNKRIFGWSEQWSRAEKGFVFVSFVPGKSDSVFVAWGHRLFIYHFPTNGLEQVYLYGLKCDFDSHRNTHDYYPFGVWPSSPPSLKLSHAISPSD